MKNNKKIATFFKIIGIIFALAGLIIVAISWIGIFLEFGAWDGFMKIQEIYSPFNVGTYAITIAIFSPAIGCYYLFEYFNKK